MKNILLRDITIEIITFYGKNNFVVNIDQNYRHSCVKSEHILREKFPPNWLDPPPPPRINQNFRKGQAKVKIAIAIREN